MTITKALAKRCYSMSEPHLSGARLIIGFSNIKDASAAQLALPDSETDGRGLEGWRFVPANPTIEQVEAALALNIGSKITLSDAAAIYNAMVLAASRANASSE